MVRSSKDPYKQDLYFRGTFFTSRIIIVKKVPLKAAIFEQDRPNTGKICAFEASLLNYTCTISFVRSIKVHKPCAHNLLRG